MITRNIKGYNFENLKTESLCNYVHSPDALVLKLRLKKQIDRDRTLFEIPGTLTVRGRYLSENAELTPYETGECYFQHTDESGFTPVIEISLFFEDAEHPQWNEMKLGLPLTLYDIVKDDLYAVFDGIYFHLVYGGRVVNYNLPYGKLGAPRGGISEKDSEYLDYIEYSTDLSGAEKTVIKETVDKKLCYYTPFGHNKFIGDIANFYHDGVYHMLYMADTHHHGNRWGCGGHHFDHIITRDFINWEEVAPVWDVDEQWQTMGTGTMFFFGGKYYVSYGYHTGRMIAPEKLYHREMWEYFEKNDRMEIIPFEKIFALGKYPIGGSYAVSDDGINFTRSNIITSFEENPSVYSVDGKLKMICGDRTYETDSMENEWTIVTKDFPPCGKKAPMLNTGECPSYFEWNGYKYLLMGWDGYWRTEFGSDEFFDSASMGFDVYDGLGVPMVTVTDDNRAILAGWLKGIGWASCAVHRELVQFGDGSLGIKWMPELTPDMELISSWNGEEYTLNENSYCIEASVRNNGEKFAIRFSGESEACELQLDFAKNRMQMATVKDSSASYCDSIPPIHEAIKEVDDIFKLGDTHTNARDFSIANAGLSGDARLRVICHYDKKLDSTIIDVELNEARTLISLRKDFKAAAVSVSGENIIKEAGIYKAEI